MPPLLHSPGKEVPIKMKIGHDLLIVSDVLPVFQRPLSFHSHIFPFLKCYLRFFFLYFLVFPCRNIDASSIKAVDTANIKVKHCLFADLCFIIVVVFLLLSLAVCQVCCGLG